MEAKLARLWFLSSFQARHVRAGQAVEVLATFNDCLPREFLLPASVGVEASSRYWNWVDLLGCSGIPDQPEVLIEEVALQILLVFIEVCCSSC